jgi:hypothetical protein
MRFICWVIGHNKILEVQNHDEYVFYFDVCSQCHKHWLNTQLSDKPKIAKPIIDKKQTKVIVQPNLQRIHQKQMIQKAKANFYVL